MSDHAHIHFNLSAKTRLSPDRATVVTLFPRARDHHSSGCLPAEKCPTFAAGRQGRGASSLFKSGVRSLVSETRASTH